MKNNWEYPADDYLDIAGRLSEKERARILGELRKEGVSSDGVECHPAFSVDGHMVIVLKKDGLRHCWFYYPEKGAIKKQGLF